jgi:hypothetical protein
MKSQPSARQWSICRLSRLRSGGARFDSSFRDVDPPALGLGQLVTVQAEPVRDQPHLDPPRLDEPGPAVFVGRVVRSDGEDPGRGHHLARGLDPLDPHVEGVVVRGVQHVEAAALVAREHLELRARTAFERRAGIADHLLHQRLVGHGGLEIGIGDVAAEEQILDPLVDPVLRRLDPGRTQDVAGRADPEPGHHVEPARQFDLLRRAGRDPHVAEGLFVFLQRIPGLVDPVEMVERAHLLGRRRPPGRAAVSRSRSARPD